MCSIDVFDQILDFKMIEIRIILNESRFKNIPNLFSLDLAMAWTS